MTNNIEKPPILSYETVRPTLHPLAIWCLAIAFLPEVTAFAMWTGFFARAINLEELLMGFLVAPLTCLILSILAIVKINKSRGTRKGLPFVIGTMIVSILHLLFCGFVVWATLSFLKGLRGG